MHIRLTAERQKRNWSQVTLGELLGVHSTTIHYWENPPRFSRPSAAVQRKLEKLFGIGAEELFGPVNASGLR